MALHTFVNGVEGKVCSSCKQWQPMIRYNQDKWAKDSHQHRCNSCPARHCMKCGIAAADCKDYGGHLDKTFGKHLAYCKLCKVQVNASYRSTDRGKETNLKAYETRGFNNGGVKLDYYEGRLLELSYGNNCLICGDICKAYADHVIPVSKGGSNAAWNRQGLCKVCNSAKADHNSNDYRPDSGALAMAIHNLRIGQHADKKLKRGYYEWVKAEIESKGIQQLHSMIDIFEWEGDK